MQSYPPLRDYDPEAAATTAAPVPFFGMNPEMQSRLAGVSPLPELGAAGPHTGISPFTPTKPFMGDHHQSMLAAAHDHHQSMLAAAHDHHQSMLAAAHAAMPAAAISASALAGLPHRTPFDHVGGSSGLGSPAAPSFVGTRLTNWTGGSSGQAPPRTGSPPGDSATNTPITTPLTTPMKVTNDNGTHFYSPAGAAAAAALPTTPQTPQAQQSGGNTANGALPTLQFQGEVVHVVGDAWTVATVQAIWQSGEKWLGLDTESRPIFRPSGFSDAQEGVVERNPPCLLQLADARRVYLVYLHTLDRGPFGAGFAALGWLLGEPSVLKCGSGVEDDCVQLARLHPQLAHSAGTVDTLRIGQRLGLPKPGLAGLTRSWLTHHIDKPRDVQCCDWEYFCSTGLDERQIMYAATDAHAGRLLLLYSVAHGFVDGVTGNILVNE